MKNRLSVLLLINCIVFSAFLTYTNGYKVVEHDSEVAASDHKSEFEKGDDKHYYDEEHEEKGEKGEKGYKGEHE